MVGSHPWHLPRPPNKNLPFSPADAALGLDSNLIYTYTHIYICYLTLPLAAPYILLSLHPFSLSSSCSSNKRGRNEVLLD